VRHTAAASGDIHLASPPHPPPLSMRPTTLPSSITSLDLSGNDTLVSLQGIVSKCVTVFGEESFIHYYYLDGKYEKHV
jgi:hypothetical protein